MAVCFSALLIGCLFAWTELPREAVWMAGIFAVAAALWMTEALPLFVTSLLVIGLEIILLANPGGWRGLGFEREPSVEWSSILSAAAHPILLLFFGGFLLARAAVKEGVDRALSALLLKPFNKSLGWLLFGLIAITALFSMWMSNTATAAMAMTIAAPLAAQRSAQDPFRKALILAVPFAANIGGMGTPVGSPPNAIATGLLRNAGHPIAFLDWMMIAVPIMLLMLLGLWGLLWSLFRPSEIGVSMKLESPKLTGRGQFVAVVFTVTALLWMTDRWHGLPAEVVSLLPIVVLTISGIIARDDVNRLDWDVLVLIGGGLALGTGMKMTGLDRLIAQAIPGLGAGQIGLASLGILVFMTVLLSTFLSNTATANLLLPVGLASLVGLPPEQASSGVQVAFGIGLAASLAMALPVSTPPNAIAYAHGGFDTKSMALAGTFVGLIGIPVILLLAPFLIRLFGV